MLFVEYLRGHHVITLEVVHHAHGFIGFGAAAISHFFFAILTMAIIPVVGSILGWLADIVMTHMGIDLRHRELSEK